MDELPFVVFSLKVKVTLIVWILPTNKSFKVQIGSFEAPGTEHNKMKNRKLNEILLSSAN